MKPVLPCSCRNRIVQHTPWCPPTANSHCYYRVWQKYLTILQNSCEWNCWHGEFVLERPSSETQSISVATELLVCRESIGLLLWRRISKTTILPRLRGYFVGTSIFIGTSVPSRNTSSSEDISRARCTKRNQGQRWI